MNHPARSSKKAIRQEGLWRHFKSFLPSPCFRSNLEVWQDYDPEQFKAAFLEFQTHGSSSLTTEEKEGIGPLVAAQGRKEITINSLVMECFEWDAKGWGWQYPLRSTIEGKPERMFRVALLRIERALKGAGGFAGRLEWFMRHPARQIDKSQFDRLLVLNQKTHGY